MEDDEKYKSFMSTKFIDGRFTITVKRTEIDAKTIKKANFRI